ncbi:hypothetical protein [Helicobacter canis]|nr:hypothetical protein [Helicobacter canis]
MLVSVIASLAARQGAAIHKSAKADSRAKMDCHAPKSARNDRKS